MNNYDVTIIGSGLSGLVSAAILSKEGYKVCVLEKSIQFGGCLQTFKRMGVEFDTGVHYIGCLGKGEFLYNFFKYLGIMDKVEFVKLDESGYDRIYYKGKEYKYAMGFENFRNTLVENFPEEVASIDIYISEIRRLVESIKLLKLEYVAGHQILDQLFAGGSLKDYLQSLTMNEDLRNVLAATNSLYASKAEDTSLFNHAIVYYSHIKSSWRHVGGSGKITRALISEIESNGGVLFNRSQVSSFEYDESNHITSVILSNGDKIGTKYVISSIHPELMLDIVGEGRLRKSYTNRLRSMDNTISVFGLYIVLKKDSFKYMNYNFFGFADDDVWSSYNYSQKEWPTQYMLMTPQTESKSEYAKSAMVLSLMNYDDVKQWENSKVGRRGKDYEDFKKEKAELLLDQVEKHFPGIRDHINCYFTSTPLTYRDYTGTKNGSIYGIAKNCNNPYSTYIPPRTKIANLILTGQSINLHGVLGVTIGSVISCGEIVGLNNLITKIRNTIGYDA